MDSHRVYLSWIKSALTRTTTPDSLFDMICVKLTDATWQELLEYRSIKLISLVCLYIEASNDNRFRPVVDNVLLNFYTCGHLLKIEMGQHPDNPHWYVTYYHRIVDTLINRLIVYNSTLDPQRLKVYFSSLYDDLSDQYDLAENDDDNTIVYRDIEAQAYKITGVKYNLDLAPLCPIDKRLPISPFAHRLPELWTRSLMLKYQILQTDLAHIFSPGLLYLAIATYIGPQLIPKLDRLLNPGDDLKDIDIFTVDDINIRHSYFDELVAIAYRTKFTTLRYSYLGIYPNAYNVPLEKAVNIYGYVKGASTYSYNLYINLIHQSLNQYGKAWLFKQQNCNNAEEEDLEQLEPRKDVMHHSTLAYGTPYDYDCYNQSELIYYWSGLRSVGDYRLLIPYKNEEFAAVQQLCDYPIDPKLRELIRETLLYYDGQEMIDTYNSCTPADQACIHQAWRMLVLISMWCRYWVGPNTPFPITWSEDQPIDGWVRDTNVVNAINAYQTHLTDCKQVEYLSNLPTYYYDFDSKTYIRSKYTLGKLLSLAAQGQKCLSYVGDSLYYSFVYYFERVAKIDDYQARFLDHVIDDIKILDGIKGGGMTLPVLDRPDLYRLDGFQPSKHIEF